MTVTSGANGESTDDESVVAPDVVLPARLDVRRAFEIYVLGRDRTLGPDEKKLAVPASAYTRPAGRDGEGALAPEVAGAAVSVPHELRFDRGAGIRRLRGNPSKEGAPSA